MTLRRFFQLAGLMTALFLAAAASLVWDGLHDDIQPSDVAVVLGNKVEPSGVPATRLQARLDRAAELYRQGCFPRIIVSGGFGKEGFDEAAVMKRYLVAAGIPDDRILEDPQGITTWATAQNTASILRQHSWRSVMVISQYFHISRSSLAMKRCGIAEVHAAHASYFEVRDLYAIPREVAGYVSYLWK
jgi:vancomycin permeability regulator SanA